MNFLTLLQETNKSEVYSCLFEMHRKPIEFVKKRYKKTIKELFSLNPVSNDEFLFVIINDTYELNDESLTVHIQKNGSTEAFIQVFSETKASECYSVLFVDWNEITGKIVPDVCINHYGKARYCSVILYEITWYGFKSKDMIKERKNIIKKQKTVPYEFIQDISRKAEKTLKRKYGEEWYKRWEALIDENWENNESAYQDEKNKVFSDFYYSKQYKKIKDSSIV